MKICIPIILIFSLSSIAYTQGPPPAPVAVTKVNEVLLEDRIQVSGRVVARHVSAISPQTSGMIRKLHFEVAEAVNKGDLLVELNDDLVRLKIKEFTALLQLSQKNVEKTKQLLNIQNKEYEDLNQALLALPGSISQKELRSEKAKLVQFQKQHNEFVQQVTINKIKLEQLSLQLSHHKIIAPFSGVIINRDAAVGQWVNIGNACFTLIDKQSLEVELDIPSHLYMNTQKASVNILAKLSDQDVNIVLEQMRIRYQVDPQSKTFIWTGKPKDTSNLLSGMSVEAYVPVSAKRKFLMVNYNAILKNDAGPFVYKVAPGKGGYMALPIPVKLGFKKGDSVVVINPALQAGDQLVSEGGERLFPMTPVAPKEDK